MGREAREVREVREEREVREVGRGRGAKKWERKRKEE